MPLDFGSQWPTIEKLLREPLSLVAASDAYNRPNFFVPKTLVIGLKRRALSIHNVLIHSALLPHSEIPSVQEIQDIARGWPLSLFRISRIAGALRCIAESDHAEAKATTESGGICVVLPEHCVVPSVRYAPAREIAQYRQTLEKSQIKLAEAIFGATHPRYIFQALEGEQPYRITTATAKLIHGYFQERIADVPHLDLLFRSEAALGACAALHQHQGNIVPD